MTGSGTSCAVLRLILRPHLERGGVHLDRFDADLDDELSTTSRQPLLDGARVLLARGYDPDAMLTMRHAGRNYDSFRPKPIGALAQWTVKERDRRGLRRERWQPLRDAPASDPVASPGGDQGLASSRKPGRRHAALDLHRVPGTAWSLKLRPASVPRDWRE